MKRKLILEGALGVLGLALLSPAIAVAQEADGAVVAPAPVADTPSPVVESPAPEAPVRTVAPAPVRSAPRQGIQSFAPEAPPREPSFLSGSINAGLGVPYGVLGAGATFGFDYLAVTAGAGTAIKGPGWSVGARLYLADTSHKFRPHISAAYGITAAYEIKVYGGSNREGTLKGFAFYGGVDHDVGVPGDFFLTYGIGVITHEDFPPDVKDMLGGDLPSTGNPVKLMFAGGYRFGGK